MIITVCLQCEGRWADEQLCTEVSEGRLSSVDNSNFSVVKTMGTFKMFLNTADEDSEKAKISIIQSSNQGTFMQNLRDHILNEPEDQHFYDFKIVCHDDVEVKCHKIVLVTQTKYFEGLLRQEDSDSVRIDFSGDIVRGCIRFLYTGDIDITGDNVQDLLVAANYLIINQVVAKCVSYIIANMDISNCVDILKFGDSFSIAEITMKATNAMAYNFSQILKKEEQLKTIPIHLFKTFLTNKLLVLRNDHGIVLPDKEKKIRLETIVKKYCEETNQEPEVESLMTTVQSLPETKVFHPFINPSSFRFGNPADHPRTVSRFSCFGEGKKFIRKVTIRTDTWANTTVISGLGLTMVAEDMEVDEVTVGAGEVAAEYEVPDGEVRVKKQKFSVELILTRTFQHINLVYGYSGWYVDNLTFILSNGKQLGKFQFKWIKVPKNTYDLPTTNTLYFTGDPVGGEGGGFRYSLSKLPNHHHCFNSYLDGIKVTTSQF